MDMPARTYSSPSGGGLEGARYGFNGKERDKDMYSLTAYDYGFRIYNPAIGKFLSVDPLAPKYPGLTPYQFASNKPINGIDLDGLEFCFFVFSQADENGNTKLELVRTQDYMGSVPQTLLLWDWNKDIYASDFGIEANIVLYDNVWRILPQKYANQSVSNISDKEWRSFKSYDGIMAYINMLSHYGDVASIALNLVMLADGIRNIYKAFRPNKRLPGSIKGSIGKLTADEKKAVLKLKSDGHAVEILEASKTEKTADFLVDGLKTELKTINNSNANTAVTKLQDAFKQGEAVVLDLRKTTFGEKEVKEIIERAAGTFSDKKLPGPVKVWTATGDYNF